ARVDAGVLVIKPRELVGNAGGSADAVRRIAQVDVAGAGAVGVLNGVEVEAPRPGVLNREHRIAEQLLLDRATPVGGVRRLYVLLGSAQRGSRQERAAGGARQRTRVVR